MKRTLEDIVKSHQHRLIELRDYRWNTAKRAASHAVSSYLDNNRRQMAICLHDANEADAQARAYQHIIDELKEMLGDVLKDQTKK